MHKIFKKILGKNIGIFIITLIFAVSSSAMLSKSSYELSHLFDALEVKGDMGVLFGGVLKIIINYAITIALIVISGIINAKYVYYMTNDLRREMTNKLFHTSYDFFDEKNTGNFVSWYTNDAKDLRGLSIEGFTDIFRLISMAISSFIALCLLNVYLGFIALGFLIFSILIPQLFQPILAKETEKVSLADEKFTEEIRDNINAYPIFLLSDKLMKFGDNIINSSETRETTVRHYSYVSSGVQGISMAVSLISQIGMTIVSVYFSIKGNAPLGTAFAAASLSGTLFNGILQFVQVLMGFKSAYPIYEKYNYDDEEKSTQTIEKLSEIQLENISVNYGERFVLEGFNQSFDATKKYALIGKSGSGKSTILKLILGLINPDEGRITVNSENLDKISKSSLYRKIGYIDQNPVLIQGTLRENLTLGEDIKDEEILKVLEITELSDFLAKEEQGLDSIIREGGKNLSGGEKERISIARAMLMGADFLLVDEATSQLDSENAIAIENMLLNRDDIGLLMVSHHFSDETILKFDEVIRI